MGAGKMGAGNAERMRPGSVPPLPAVTAPGRNGRRQLGAALTDLHRYLGNRYVGRMMRAMRDGAPVSSPDDRHEREADRFASRAARPAAVPAGAVPDGSGRGIPAPVRAPLEESLGRDFSGVRVHTDSGADRLARGFGAVAFTTGQDIFFRRGRYDPGGQAGHRLLAHELSHVAQQRTMSSPLIQRKMGLEYEVDDIHTRHTRSWGITPAKTWVHHDAGDFMMHRTDYDLTADIATGTQQPYSRLEFRTRAFDETDPLEVARLLAVVTGIQGDIQAIRVATAANLRGYGAGTLLGGRQGWFAGEGWVGLDKIPRLRGPWYHQVNYAGKLHKDATGSLQLTAGLNLLALQRLISGAQLGRMDRWPQAAQSDWRQFLQAYARGGQDSPQLYLVARRAVRHYDLARGGDRDAEGMMAAILAVMAQIPISQRGGTFQAGKMLAKTNYAVIIDLARAEGMGFTRFDLLRALLETVNAHIQGPPVGPDDPVIPHAGPPDLTKVTFRQWVNTLMPRAKHGKKPAKADLLTKAKYPGTPPERAALRAFGPYGHTDPGQRTIFELRSIMNNPSSDLTTLVPALVSLMDALHD